MFFSCSDYVQSIILWMFARLLTYLIVCMYVDVCVRNVVYSCFFSAHRTHKLLPTLFLSRLSTCSLARLLLLYCYVSSFFPQHFIFFSPNTFPSSLFCAFAIALACNIKIGWTAEVNAKFTGMHERRKKNDAYQPVRQKNRVGKTWSLSLKYGKFS